MLGIFSQNIYIFTLEPKFFFFHEKYFLNHSAFFVYEYRKVIIQHIFFFYIRKKTVFAERVGSEHYGLVYNFFFFLCLPLLAIELDAVVIDELHWSCNKVLMKNPNKVLETNWFCKRGPVSQEMYYKLSTYFVKWYICEIQILSEIFYKLKKWEKPQFANNFTWNGFIIVYCEILSFYHFMQRTNQHRKIS